MYGRLLMCCMLYEGNTVRVYNITNGCVYKFQKKKRGWRIKKKGGEVKEWPDSWATSHFCAFGRVNKSTSIFGSINLIELLRQATGGDVAARDALPVNAHTQGRGSFVFPPLFFFCVCVLKLVDFLFLG